MGHPLESSGDPLTMAFQPQVSVEQMKAISALLSSFTEHWPAQILVFLPVCQSWRCDNVLSFTATHFAVFEKPNFRNLLCLDNVLFCQVGGKENGFFDKVLWLQLSLSLAVNITKCLS